MSIIEQIRVAYFLGQCSLADWGQRLTTRLLLLLLLPLLLWHALSRSFSQRSLPDLSPSQPSSIASSVRSLNVRFSVSPCTEQWISPQWRLCLDDHQTQCWQTYQLMKRAKRCKGRQGATRDAVWRVGTVQPYFAVELRRKPCCLGACTTTTITTVLHLLFRYIDFSFSFSLLLWPVIGQAMVSPCALLSSSTRCTNFLIESRRQESTQHRVQQTNSYLLRAKQTQVKTQRSVHATLPASSDCNQAHSISHPLTWHPLVPAEPHTRPQHHQQHKQQQQKLWMAFFAAIGLTRMHWASIAAGRQCHQIGIKVKSTK